MGLEHLIAALGATWFVNAQEKKRLRQAAEETAALQKLWEEQRREETKEREREEKQKDKHWTKRCFNDYRVDPERYETQTEYETALRQKRQKFEAYKEAMDTLNAHEGMNLRFFVLRVETLEKLLEERPSHVPDEIYFYLLYLHYCVPFAGGTRSTMEVEYFEALKVLAKQHVCDMDEILEQAERGKLLPEGAKLLRNVYLSTYVLTKERVLWTLRPSNYYYRNYGFTVEEFSRHCGDRPSYYFAPSIRGCNENSSPAGG